LRREHLPQENKRKNQQKYTGCLYTNMDCKRRVKQTASPFDNYFFLF